MIVSWDSLHKRFLKHGRGMWFAKPLLSPICKIQTLNASPYWSFKEHHQHLQLGTYQIISCYSQFSILCMHVFITVLFCVEVVALIACDHFSLHVLRQDSQLCKVLSLQHQIWVLGIVWWVGVLPAIYKQR